MSPPAMVAANGSGHLTWRVIGGSVGSLLFIVLGWVSTYVIRRIDSIEDELHRQAVVIEEVTNLVGAQSERFAVIVKRLDRDIDAVAQEVDSIRRADREVVRQEIRSALASRGIR